MRSAARSKLRGVLSRVPSAKAKCGTLPWLAVSAQDSYIKPKHAALASLARSRPPPPSLFRHDGMDPSTPSSLSTPPPSSFAAWYNRLSCHLPEQGRSCHHPAVCSSTLNSSSDTVAHRHSPPLSCRVVAMPLPLIWPRSRARHITAPCYPETAPYLP